jgi:tRNA A37 methylthiotransferase MiaB
VDVLVDAVTPPRGHDHAQGSAGYTAQVSGRTRGNKLVHISGGTDLVGREVTVRIEHAGPYALRGVAVGD